ncbi:MAG: M1 family metallopeptidase [Saprospiraceae bacterium]
MTLPLFRPIRLISFLGLLVLPFQSMAQPDFFKADQFTRADTLRGMLRPERTCYDVTFYHLNVDVYPEKQYLEGTVDIHFTTLADFDRLQIDLFANMKITKVVYEQQALAFERKDNAVFISFPKQLKGTKGIFKVEYNGQPLAAQNPPWDGGFVWRKDKQGKDWIGVACEGTGASLWWPNKDHLSDEPDSMAISIGVPNHLMAVSNGNLTRVEQFGNRNKYHWRVSYPINNYNISVNIADYANWKETYQAADGSELELDYYVLKDNEAKAKIHFAQVHEVLQCYEQYFGKYPFWKDGYALVETPYLGMEHQGAIAYGNQYMKGYLGSMIPQGMTWDYIIVHETGHEYFGNSISCNDHAEMWIHESFTTYMEALFIECKYNYQEAVSYLQSQRIFIMNEEPILGPMDVNWNDWKGSDHYYKGAWILHTLRNVIDKDELWFELLKSLHTKYAISNLTTADVIRHFSTGSGKDLFSFFEQYLRYAQLPCLEYDLEETKKGITLTYRWDADVANFDMPVKVGIPGHYTTIYPKNKEWQEIKLPQMDVKHFKVAKELFLVRSRPK